LGDLKDRTWKVSDQAVTIVLQKEDTKGILVEGYLRIGAVRCRVEKRIVTKRCRRCWSFDHKTVGCKGPEEGLL
jgi:hypothetical protein